MTVTESDIRGIPPGNVRVPLDDFVRAWRTADEGGGWYAAGVAGTCRWMAAATFRPSNGLWHPAYAPVTDRQQRAHAELIEAEFLAAEKLAMRSPRPDWLVRRPGWSEAICATLRWAWRRSGPSPLSLAGPAAG